MEKITLETPIQQGEKEITEITLRKPQAGELRGLSIVELLNMDVQSICILLPRISTPMITKEQAAKMDTVDICQVGGVVANFFVTAKVKKEFQIE